MYKIVYEKQAAKDIVNLKSAKLEKKAKELVEIVRNNPFQSPPPFEALIGNLSGMYSRRMTNLDAERRGIDPVGANKYSASFCL